MVEAKTQREKKTSSFCYNMTEGGEIIHPSFCKLFAILSFFSRGGGFGFGQRQKKKLEMCKKIKERKA